jgi:AcrR family transcriptional regulator
VEDIARRAGVSKGAFYLHFATKDQAFEQLLHRFLAALDTALARARTEEPLADHRTEPRARTQPRPRALAARLALETAVEIELLEVLWRHRTLLPAIGTATGTRHARVVGAFRQRVREAARSRVDGGQRAGLLRRDLAAGTVADLLVGAHEDLARAMAELREKPDLAAWARDLLRLGYEGLLAHRPAATPPPVAAASRPPARRPRGRREPKPLTDPRVTARAARSVTRRRRRPSP